MAVKSAHDLTSKFDTIHQVPAANDKNADADELDSHRVRPREKEENVSTLKSYKLQRIFSAHNKNKCRDTTVGILRCLNCLKRGFVLFLCDSCFCYEQKICAERGLHCLY